MKKVLLSAFVCVALSATAFSKTSKEDLRKKSSEELSNTVECFYTIWVKDRNGKEVYGYSVHNNSSDMDCLKGILAEVMFLEFKYPDHVITYYFNTDY